MAILHVFAPKPRAAKYVKQKWVKLKREVNKSTVIAEDFNTPLSLIGQTTRQEISKDIENSTIPSTHRLELTFIEYVPPALAEYPFFSRTCRMHIKIDYTLGNNTNYNKFKIIEITQNVVFDHRNKIRYQ